MWMKINGREINVGRTSATVWLDDCTHLPTTLSGVAGLALADGRKLLAHSLERLHKLTTHEPQRPLAELRQAERLAKPEKRPVRAARSGRRPIARRRTHPLPNG